LKGLIRFGRNLKQETLFFEIAKIKVWLDCIFCEVVVQISNHLLLHCDFALGVWYAVSIWLGLTSVNPPNLFILSPLWSVLVTQNQRNKSLMLIWHVVLWSIWKAWNDSIFNNKAVTVLEAVDNIKVTTWRWYLGRLAKLPCLLYEWLREPCGNVWGLVRNVLLDVGEPCLCFQPSFVVILG
jgi:hypothetical protein